MDYITLATKELEEMHLVEIRVNIKPKPVPKKERKSVWYYVAWPLVWVGLVFIDMVTFLAARR